MISEELFLQAGLIGAALTGCFWVIGVHIYRAIIFSMSATRQKKIEEINLIVQDLLDEATNTNRCDIIDIEECEIEIVPHNRKQIRKKNDR